MYKRTIWQDHVEGIQDGTDMNAANFNNLEAGVMETAALAALNAEISRYSADMAKNTEVFYFSETIQGANEIHRMELGDIGKRNFTNYNVSYGIVMSTGGNVGDFFITEKGLDFFNVEYTGTASDIIVNFYVSGGMY